MPALPPRGRAFAAALVLALGAGALLWTALDAPRALIAVWRPQLDLRMLREMASPLAEPAAARRLHEQAPAARGTAADFLRGERAEWGALVKEESAASAGPGWTLRTARLEGDAVPMADVALLLERAEGQRPPWRAAQLELTPAGTGGAVRVALALERLERAGS